MIPINEDFLQYIWRYQLFNRSHLMSHTGMPIEIVHAGHLNRLAGPDFHRAEVIMDKKRWYGSIEVHRKSSQWYAHKHHEDPQYSKVILHVVFEHDLPSDDPLCERIPHLCLKDRIPISYQKNYQYFQNSQKPLPCTRFIDTVPETTLHFWQHRMMIEKLEYKEKQVLSMLKSLNNNWEHLSYVMVARYYGMKQNNDSLEVLFKHISPVLLHKCSESILSVEALLFGMAGMLEQDVEADEYYRDLCSQFEYIKRKFDITALHLPWNYMRSRPQNFPTIRLAQLANFIYRKKNIFRPLIEIQDIKTLKSFLSSEVSEYWQYHYLFQQLHPKKTTKKTGNSLINSVMVNAIVPILFTYGRIHKHNHSADLVFQLMDKMPAESNRITKLWSEAGSDLSSIGQSQAVIHLYEHYCRKLRCLDCAIGHKIITKKANI